MKTRSEGTRFQGKDFDWPSFILVCVAVFSTVVAMILLMPWGSEAASSYCCTDLSICNKTRENEHKAVRNAIELLKHRHPAQAQEVLEGILEP